jgi:AraC-like DNA-binding protein
MSLNVQESYDVVSNPYEKKSDSLRILFAGHSQTRKGHQNGPKVFDYYLVHHILSGRGIFTSGDQVIELFKGDSFLIEPGKLVSYKADLDEPWQYRWIAIQGSEAEKLFTACGVDWQMPIIHAQAKSNMKKWSEGIQLAFKERKAGGEHRALGYLYLILSEFEDILKPEGSRDTESMTRIERHVKQVTLQLTTQYAEPISIESLADGLGYNRAYFSKMFKAYNHVTPVTFLLNMRIGKARQLLRERSELTIEQIAYSVGFNDPLYFSKQFKRFYNQSPSQYRKSVEHLQRG